MVLLLMTNQLLIEVCNYLRPTNWFDEEVYVQLSTADQRIIEDVCCYLQLINQLKKCEDI